jgi:nicotinamide mononucleotide transporter
LTLRRSISLIVEALAVILSLAYTFLYLRGAVPLAYYPAIVGSGLFVFLCWQKRIYAESVLQLFYVGLAIYGIFATEGDWKIIRWPLESHLPWLAAGALLTFLTGLALHRFSDAKTPYLDAFTTIFSLIATWLMVNYVIENWLYWIVIDTVAIFLYAFRRLYLSALLFVLYLLMAIDGYFDTITWFAP